MLLRLSLDRELLLIDNGSLKGAFFMKIKIIKKFVLDKASYKLEDNSGNRLLMRIDYWDGNFELKDEMVLNDKIIMLKNKASRIARKLLVKKHKINFAQKFN